MEITTPTVTWSLWRRHDNSLKSELWVGRFVEDVTCGPKCSNLRLNSAHPESPVQGKFTSSKLTQDLAHRTSPELQTALAHPPLLRAVIRT